ncbi:ParB/RepB/Spo0J family partition protein [Aerococcus kribbianus]|uniref:ParB/RepB/Spo0J family partition protein n=1 Tax=Aerococcus kribbianus TaxID=2999064 RepID=A0A9X3FNN0_9LACT|nr:MULTISPECIES: ParB/RepB/Spo0J family partition protein [unclassified Aerococcus]MCZ0717624.1 ParB/RepB/Spo0J family partition protein [Aerococcus sp. YH-aer221]MCZ0725912.1 ParB/RepB/Spo0J family partition protein [Aerococcus sp. YH-aer222]
MANHKKGLGRGIDALFAPSEDVFDETKEVVADNEASLDDQRVQEVNLSEIRPNPYQPRTHFSEEAMEELTASIKEQGVFQPIILRQSAIKGYEIIAGERRFRAAKRADLETIPAIVRDMSDEAMVEVAIIENLQREDLTPLEEATAYKNMMDQLDLTQAEVSQRLGKSRTHVANFVRLLGLNQDVKDMVQSGDLSMGQARTLLGLKNKKDQSRLAKKVINEGMTVRQLEKMVQALNEPAEKVKTPPKKLEKPAYIRESEDKLMDRFGTSVQIKDQGKRGKIEIEYLSQDDLTRILDILQIRLDD